MAKKLLTIIIILLFVGTSMTYSIVGGYHQSKTEENETLLNKPLFEFGKTLVKEPPILWNFTINEGFYDVGRYIEQTDDGGFLIIGDLCSPPNVDIGIIKIDANCSFWWESIVDFGYDETIRSILKTNDGGFLITGPITNGIWDIVIGLGFYLVKLNYFGYEQWNLTYFYNDPSNNYNYFDALLGLSDGGFLVGGITYWINDSSEKPSLMKIDANGIIEWEILSLTINGREITQMFETNDKSYLIACDKCLCKIDSLGNKLWEQRYSYGGRITRIFEADNDEYQLIFADSEETDYIRILCINSTGHLLSERTISRASIKAATKTNDGGYIIFASNSPTHYLFKFDENWTEEWNKTYYYQAENPSHWFKNFYFSLDSDGGYTMVIRDGWPNEYKFIKTDNYGKEKWNKTIKPPHYSYYLLPEYSINCIRQTNDLGYILCGYKTNPNDIDWEWDDNLDIYLTKVSGVPLELRNILGGKSVSFVIDNDGYDDFPDIDWQIEYEGNIWKGNNSSGVIELLEAGKQITVKAEPVSGFGWGNVTIKVEDLSYKTQVFFLGPFVIIDRGYKKLLDEWLNQLFPKLK